MRNLVSETVAPPPASVEKSQVEHDLQIGTVEPADRVEAVIEIVHREPSSSVEEK